MPALSQAEIDDARKWWQHLPDRDKGNQPIWIILAMYARDWSKKNTVHFPQDEIVAEIGPDRVPKGEHNHVLDRERQKA